MVRLESWEIVRTEIRSLGDMLNFDDTGGVEQNLDRDNAATMLSYYHEQYQRLLKKRAILDEQESSKSATNEQAELLHALKRIEMEKQVLKRSMTLKMR